MPQEAVQYKHISAGQVREKLRSHQPLQLVDVRNRQHWQQSRLPAAVIGDDTAALAQLDPDVTTVVYCYKGISSQLAAATLAEAGFTDVYTMDGGFEVWNELFGDEPQAVEKPRQ